MKNLFLFILLFVAHYAKSAHLVGGEISYECLGNNLYEITLKVYRDCNSSGAPFDGVASIAIYKEQDMSMFTTLSPSHGGIIVIPPVVNNPCLQTPPNICTQLAIYKAQVTLPPTTGGYIITYQRCCRNQTISNIPNPGSWGSTYTVRVPAISGGCNSSPEYLSNPPIVLCNLDSLHINSMAAEPDGDSLFYEFCSPLHGGSQGNPAPVPPSAPPYTNVPFSAGYSASNPIPGNPTIQINSSTGLITGRPMQPGQYVVAICVSEYRNGVFLSTVRRDYQFNVTNCQSNVQANIITNPLYCTGRTVSFSDNSINGSNFYWDFGDLNISSDTSTQQNPVYTYADTGTYHVTMIVNKGWTCSDTIIKTIRVHYPANASFVKSGPLCLENGKVNFAPTSNNTNADSFLWNFGANAVPQTSTNRFPPGVTFNMPGKHVVFMEVNSFGCIKRVYDTVEIHLKPEGNFTLDNRAGCVPFTVNFTDSSISSTPLIYEWDFGDGTTSNLPSPSHTYTLQGNYDVFLRVYTTEGCVDTSEVDRPGLITANPSPTSAVDVTPTKTSIYESVVEVTDLGTPASEDYFVDMGDGSIFRNTAHFFYQYRDTGTYSLIHVVTNSSGCTDTSHFEIRINPVPLIFAPNAFSPNGDGENDIYLPAIVGALEYEMSIFNRWGQAVFHTKNPREGWNGQIHNNGQTQPAGVYTFTIFVRDVNFEVANKRGYITLIR